MCSALGICVTVLRTRFQENATLLGAIRWRGSQATSNRSQTPLLDVGFDKVEAGLSEVDMDDGGTVGTDGREEILGFETMNNFVELLTVASKEDCACSWPVPNPDNIALYDRRTIWSRRERLVIAT